MVEKVEEKKSGGYVAKAHIAVGGTGERYTIFAGEAIPASVAPEMLAKWIKRGLVITKDEADKIEADKAAEEKKAKAALKR